MLGTFDLSDLAAFQSVFGMIFTVIIAVEFKRTLLLVSEPTDSVVQVRAVILIALLAVVRKLIILDISPGDVASSNSRCPFHLTPSTEFSPDRPARQGKWETRRRPLFLRKPARRLAYPSRGWTIRWDNFS